MSLARTAEKEQNRAAVVGLASDTAASRNEASTPAFFPFWITMTWVIENLGRCYY